MNDKVYILKRDGMICGVVLSAGIADVWKSEADEMNSVEEYELGLVRWPKMQTGNA